MNPTPSPERPEPPEGYELNDSVDHLPEGAMIKSRMLQSDTWGFAKCGDIPFSYHTHWWVAIPATRTAPEAVAGEPDEFPGNLKGPSPIVREYEGPFAVRGDNPPMVVSKDGESVLSMMWPVHEQTREGEIAAMDYTTKLALRIVDELNTSPEASKDAELARLIEDRDAYQSHMLEDATPPEADKDAEKEQQSYEEADGCPTEGARLRREWRQQKADLTTARSTMAERDKLIAGLVEALEKAQASIKETNRLINSDYTGSHWDDENRDKRHATIQMIAAALAHAAEGKEQA